VHVTSINFELKHAFVHATLLELFFFLEGDEEGLHSGAITQSFEANDLNWFYVRLRNQAGKAKEVVKLLLSLEGVCGCEMVSEELCSYGTETLCPVLCRRCPTPYAKM
jgi:hypothetical protein